MEAHRSPQRRRETAKRHPEGIGEHPLTDRGQLVLLAVFAAVWIADSFIVHATDFLSGTVAAAIRWPVGAAVMIASGLLAFFAHRTIFAGAERSPRLITGGAYAIVRHPLYLGSWLFLVGLTLTTLSLASAAVNVLTLAFYLWVSRFEEKLLLETFGPSYRAYQARTPMFFPLKVRSTRCWTLLS
jgi:protein-S-isoprenylcysteine O-methyltransferase Ste14